MKQGRTLPELACELERQANAKRDFLAPANRLKVHTNGRTQLLLPDAFDVNDIAHGQLAEYAGVPKGFYDRLRNASEDLMVPLPEDEQSPLFDVVVNCLLENKGQDTRLVRTLDGKARAFLSDSFSVDLDNFDVFQVAAKSLMEAGLEPENVISCEVTERRLYLKVVSPKREATIQPSNLHRRHGDHYILKEPQVVQAGFVLMNSETGLGSLCVQQVVYKLMCTNLWIREDAYRQRHIGKVLESGEDGSVYRSDTRIADAHARLLKVRDHVASALDETRFRTLVSKMQETTEVRLEGNIERVVEVTGRKFGFSQEEKSSVLKNLIEGADLSLWGLTNAITQTAQEVESYDRATELEAIGGRFFSLPTPEIRELAKAA